MKIAPLIYSRTYFVDFNDNFAVRHADLNIKWARDKIFAALGDLEEPRFITAYDEEKNIHIAGIACNLQEFIEDNFKDIDVKDFCDKFGRRFNVFLGYSYKGDTVPNVNNAVIWEMFKKYLAPKWKEKAFQTVFLNDDKLFTVDEKIPKNIKFFTGNNKKIEFYILGENESWELVAYCLKNNKNFCSNVKKYSIITSNKFDAIETAKSNIKRYESDQQEKKNSMTKTTPITKPTPKPQKISTLAIAAIILILLTIFGYFLTREPEKDTKQLSVMLTKLSKS
ncbi:MAG: hypothetical protein IJT73_07750 [Selenomonadaceae bacterium]|nr:hypothetical protein [Selenomonadaceae bacterium]